MQSTFRRIEATVAAVVLVVAAFSTGLPYLFYLLYLGLLVAGGSYVVTRLGLADLEAGYAVNRLAGHVGDELRVTYTVRNVGRLPKPWLELYNPTDLPSGIPARAIALGGRRERSWFVRVPLTERGTFEIDPLLVRTADPFGLFESTASVGRGVALTVYPRLDPIPRWRLPAANLEGTHARPERTLQTTPLATAVRPWAPGDSFNRIHWRSTARQGELQVKEFELERTADVWIALDLDAAVQAGRDERSTVEVGIRVAAAIAHEALEENRAVGVSLNVGGAAGGARDGGRPHHASVLPADRGPRQRSKVMQLLAAVDGDGEAPFAETLVATVPRLRQGMTLVAVTPSFDRTWVRPLALLRSRGVATVVVLLDQLSFLEDAAARSAPRVELPAGEGEALADQLRALRHALAEHGIRVHRVGAGEALGEVLAS